MPNRYVRSALIVVASLMLPVASSVAQTTGTRDSTPGIGTPGIGLTADHKRTIYREIGSEPARRIPDGSQVTIGSEIPDSVILNDMPISVKDRIGLLRDFKFAKLPDETIVIVDPAKRQVVDMVTKADGTQ